MKKINQIIICSIAIWLILSLATGWSLNYLKVEKDTTYKVEINRLSNSLSAGIAPDELDLCSYNYVKRIDFLNVCDTNDKELINDFYALSNEFDMQILPIYVQGQLAGYARFDYMLSEINTAPMFVIMESILLLVEIFVIAILWYLKNRLIRPFEKMQEIPHELAKGHLKSIVKVEKNKFFGKFLWGISILSDRLDVEKKRNLELEKEKKTMLVSLSHDIKTPLNNIKLYARALEEDIYSTEEEKKHALRQIGKKTKDIEKYVEEIMKHAREDILDIQVSKGEFYLDELMNRSLSDYTEKCAIRMVDLKVASHENRLIKGDLDRSVEVLENIFENAFKYGDGRKIEIDFWEEEECQLIRIFNTGEPVSENDFNHIFESFFRAANSEGKQGNGLGLYICREIMRKMGGSIYAERRADGMAIVLVYAN